MNVTLAPGILEDLIAQAQDCFPTECCGFIAGRNGVGYRVIRMKNTLPSSTAYEMDPPALISVLRELRESGEETIAIYHSHPHGPANPSKQDIDRAYYPDAAYVIISLADSARPHTRAFRILDGQVFEVELHAIV